MVYQIVKFGNSSLRETAKPVLAVTDEVRKLAEDMLESMRVANGVGLAAEQIGRTESICVIDVPAESEKKEHVDFNSKVTMPLVLINPEIKKLSGTQRNGEGCLSFPDIYVQVARADEVTVEYTALDGERHTATARGLLARAIQHECDHLNGVLLVDKMSSVQRLASAGKLRRMKEEA